MCILFVRTQKRKPRQVLSPQGAARSVVIHPTVYQLFGGVRGGGDPDWVQAGSGPGTGRPAFGPLDLGQAVLEPSGDPGGWESGSGF